MPPMQDPFSSPAYILQGYYQANQVMNTTGWACISCDMKPGSIATSSGRTTDHVVTTHVGRAIGPTQSCWTEAGVYRSPNGATACRRDKDSRVKLFSLAYYQSGILTKSSARIYSDSSIFRPCSMISRTSDFSSGNLYPS